MTRGVRQGTVTRSELIAMLNLDKKGKYQKNELLDKALASEKINLEVYQESLPRRNSAIKCYLRSVVKDRTMIERIEKYVEMASLLFTRGSIIANLITLNELGQINKMKFSLLPAAE